jgi:multisubunit Na+/H+ antiporter MnhF subunit
VNAWLLAACVLLPAAVGPCVWRACRGEPAQRLAGMALTGVVSVAFFLCAARGLHRTSYTDVALVAAVLTPTGTLVFSRCLAGGSGTDPGEWRRARGDGRPDPSAPSGPAAPPSTPAHSSGGGDG